MCRFFNLLFILFHIQVPLFPFFLMPLAIRESDKLIIFHYFCGRNYINEAKLTPFLKPITPPPQIYVLIGIFSQLNERMVQLYANYIVQEHMFGRWKK